MKKHLLVITIFLSAALIFIGAVIYLMPKKMPKETIQTTGLVEAREVNLSSKINQKLVDIKFREGDYIKRGDVAIILDADKIKAQYNQARANLGVAHANFLNARAEIDKAEVKIQDTKRDLDRMSRLLAQRLVAQNDKDKARTNYDLAVADLNKAKAQSALSRASIKEAEAALAVAKTNLDDTVIVSDLSGVITLRAFEPGEMVTAGATILTVIDPAFVWARVDVEETAVARIRLGDIAYVSVDALPREEFKGRVSEINSEGEFATQNDVKRGRQDIKTFRVKVKIDESRGVLKPGMTAIVKFNVK